LRDEIAGGALSNIADSSRIWAARRPNLIGAEVTRRVRTDLEQLLEVVLDLLTPRHAEAVTQLRSPHAVAPGQTAAITTRLANETTRPVDLGLRCGDLFAEPHGHIKADSLRVTPGRVHIPAGGTVDVEIGLQVPAGARPGQYQAVLEATDRAGLRAVLTFVVH
jgi:hypothetical protein